MSPDFAKISAAAIIAATTALLACQAQTQPKPNAPPARSKQYTNVGALLTWPLQGKPGFDRVGAELHRLFAMEPMRQQQFSGDGPVRLEDGVLSFGYISVTTQQFDIGVELDPCYPAERAVKLTGAVEEPGYFSLHGIDIGKGYKATGNGMMVRFDTFPQAHSCVKTIHIHPVRAQS
ncbi:hypothetical protein J5226_11695 [Lysobacter sp. K5869]|uniref:hypothetical protein n=1 Tax=Lysobacter sp. K5869 TaxID=2820808 RepID=UPI001C06375E|nr:hypothetical protein [Lysobacter sp. K5869]QWP79004.1 hypothetical protein J5226_11695 [Lysobacter sp. K5869]